jgi:hypothetical protein
MSVPGNWGAYFKGLVSGVANKSKNNIKNYRVNKEIKNASSYEPISIDYTKLEDNENLSIKDEYLQSLFNRMYNTITAYDNGSFYSALYGSPLQRMNMIDPADETYFQTVSDISSLNPAGIFSFTYYKPTISFSSLIKQEQLSGYTIHNTVYNYLSPGNLERNIKRIYLQGILKYLELTMESEFENSKVAFKNWKVAVYTDKYTINYFKNIRDQIVTDSVKKVEDVLEYYYWLKLYTHPNAIILCVTMPAYSMNNAGEIVEYSVIRMTRFHAFQLFPHIPVFIRDADTLFTKNPSYLLFKTDVYTPIMPETDKEFLYKWESTFYENFRDKNGEHPFCIGVNHLYKKPWHYDPNQDKESLGIFAGFVSSLGGIEEWGNGTLWDSCMKYIESHALIININNSLKKNSRFIIKNNKTKKITNNVTKAYPSNHLTYATYIGKDEQILIFAVLPQLFSKTYFYYLDVIQVSDSFSRFAKFRKNSPLAEEKNYMPTNLTSFIYKNVRYNVIDGKSKIYLQNKEISSGDVEIFKINNIFNTPEIHESLRRVFDIIINGGGIKRPRENNSNMPNGSRKKLAGGRIRNKTVKRRA